MHGVLRLPWYIARLRSGACAPVAQPQLLVNAGAIGVWGGHDSMGQVLAALRLQPLEQPACDATAVALAAGARL
ncbi:MAG: Ldh family oxidoreductase [Janthinobacterium lividum]